MHDEAQTRSLSKWTDVHKGQEGRPISRSSHIVLISINSKPTLYQAQIPLKEPWGTWTPKACQRSAQRLWKEPKVNLCYILLGSRYPDLPNTLTKECSLAVNHRDCNCDLRYTFSINGLWKISHFLRRHSPPTSLGYTSSTAEESSDCRRRVRTATLPVRVPTAPKHTLGVR